LQAEASTVPASDPDYPSYAPDTSSSEFNGKSFDFPDTPSRVSSPHATGVAQLFYGNASSMAPGVTDIQSFEVNGWLQTLQTTSGTASVTSRRIANHSWVGIGDTTAETGQILRKVDRQVERNEFVQVVGLANGPADYPLLGGAYNVIAVGTTQGVHDQGSDAVDAVYGAARSRPEIVAPIQATSSATPVVSAAAALLIETGHKVGASLSEGFASLPGVGTVYNAERSETIKAALMAGADRFTANTSFFANITDYRSAGHQTANGLDDRFGAGQVNIYHSYQIIAAGEQNSFQDGGGAIGPQGFDYDPAFGGAEGSNSTATYFFTSGADQSLSATLAWNIGVSDDLAMNTTLHHLTLSLFDLTSNSTVAVSGSALDNTQNLWVSLFSGHQYELRVGSADSGTFSWDYALAWRTGPAMAPVPLPAAVVLLVSGLAGLSAFVRRRS
jgi:hypothetical protein